MYGPCSVCGFPLSVRVSQARGTLTIPCPNCLTLHQLRQASSLPLSPLSLGMAALGLGILIAIIVGARQ